MRGRRRSAGVRLLVLAALAVLLAPVPVLTGARPSAACSCALDAPIVLAERADVVLTGTVVRIDRSRVGSASTDPVVYDVEVDGVHQGGATAISQVSSAAYGASCGLEGMAEGQRYLFFLRGSGSSFDADLCGGTQPYGAPGSGTGAPSADVEQLLTDLGRTDPEPGGALSEPTPRPHLAVGGAVVAVGLLAGLAVLLVRRSRRG